MDLLIITKEANLEMTCCLEKKTFGFNTPWLKSLFSKTNEEFVKVIWKILSHNNLQIFSSPKVLYL